MTGGEVKDQTQRVPRRLAVPVVIAFVSAAAIIGQALGSSAAPRPAGSRAAVGQAAIAKSSHAVPGDPIYLYLSGISGESTTEGYVNWIDVASWRWAVGNTGSSSKPSLNIAVVSLPLSRAIPPLVARLLSHRQIDNAVLAFVRSVGGRATPYLQLKFSNVLVTSWSEASDGQAPVEQVAFTFKRVQYVYAYQDPTGASSQYQVCWDRTSKAVC
jgi:type VI secretion system secreted protein Hcp